MRIGRLIIKLESTPEVDCLRMLDQKTQQVCDLQNVIQRNMQQYAVSDCDMQRLYEETNAANKQLDYCISQLEKAKSLFEESTNLNLRLLRGTATEQEKQRVLSIRYCLP